MIIPPMPMALMVAVLDCDLIRGKVSSLGMLREINSVEYIWHISFRRGSDGKYLTTYVSVPIHEANQFLIDPEAEIMEIVQLAIYEEMING